MKENSERSYEIGRIVDHLITHFQCDKFHFINIQGSVKDERFLVTMRRSTLDEFWSREPETVKEKLTMVKRLGKLERN